MHNHFSKKYMIFLKLDPIWQTSLFVLSKVVPPKGVYLSDVYCVYVHVI